MPKYHLMEFVEDGNPIEIVPDVWIDHYGVNCDDTSNEKDTMVTCFWPPDKRAVRSLLEKQAPPGTHWECIKGKLLYSDGRYFII
jgi:hypothetical protein